MNKEKVPFTCVKIAEQFEHEVNFTPPYHCKLQPIEGVWSVKLHAQVHIQTFYLLEIHY